MRFQVSVSEQSSVRKWTLSFGVDSGCQEVKSLARFLLLIGDPLTPFRGNKNKTMCITETNNADARKDQCGLSKSLMRMT